MKIQLFSDIHTEWHHDKGSNWLKSLDPENVDVLVIAGDLGSFQNLKSILIELGKKYPNVVYVSGNHELYGTSFEFLSEIRDELKEISNLHWLQNSFVTIQDQRFVGTTMWFRENPDAFRVKDLLTDFRVIKDFDNKVYKENAIAIEFLNETIKSNDIVVTHHLPTELSVPRRFKTSLTNMFYVCEMSELIYQRKPKMWFHGHTHDSVDFILHDTRIIANPYGYKGYSTNPNFDQELRIEISECDVGI